MRRSLPDSEAVNWTARRLAPQSLPAGTGIDRRLVLGKVGAPAFVPLKEKKMQRVQFSAVLAGIGILLGSVAFSAAPQKDAAKAEIEEELMAL